MINKTWSERVQYLFSVTTTGILFCAVVFALFQTFWANENTREVGYAQDNQYDLRIDKEMTSWGLVFSWYTVSYQLEIFNAEEWVDYDASNVEVTDVLPSGMTFVDGSLSSSEPLFFFTVNSYGGTNTLHITIDGITFDADETITFNYDALVSSTGTMKNVASIQPETGDFIESVPYANEFCTPGHDPINGDLAAPTTNNIDCEQFTVQVASLPPECGNDDITNNGGTVFYGSTVPTQLCNEGSNSVPQNTVEIWKWTWTCISWWTTETCEALNPHCWDTTIDTGIPWVTDETCDDGNTDNLDGCSSTCQIEGCTMLTAYNYDALATEDDWSCIYCGDGVTQPVWETGWFVEECDDDNNTANDWCSATCKEEIVRFTTVVPETDQVTIENFGTETVDISSYRLCSKFSYTSGWGLQDLNVTAGSLNLAPWASVTLDWFAFDDTSADLWLYEPTGGFSSSDAMSDFVQRWSAGNGRESVANAKGIWTSGEFLDENAPFTYPGDGTSYGVTVWNDIPSVCGNWDVEVWEVCDDSGTLNWDWCSADCSGVEAGWECLVEGAACTDLDECSLSTDNCHVNAACVNNDGGFSCDCSGWFSGDWVATCDDVDECISWSDNCSDDATCTNTIGAFMCACDFGFNGDGVLCTDIDECATWANNCDVNATCSNEPGTFSCDCNPWYAGPWNNCVEVCGDGIPTPGEECDDSNFASGDWCSDSCEWEIPSCDLALSPTSGSLSLAVSGTVQNTDSWELVTWWTWGDWATEPAGTNQANHTYFASWMWTVEVQLTHRDNWWIIASCENFVEASTACGDWNLEFWEQCDDWLLNGIVCDPAYDSSCTYCSVSCRELTVVGWFCGDATPQISEWELCDLGSGNNNGTCVAPYGGSCDACTSACISAVFQWGFCGDGIVDIWYEQCDDANLDNDDQCQNTCIRGNISSWVWSSVQWLNLVREPKIDRQTHNVAQDFMRISPTSRFSQVVKLPTDIKHIPMYTPGAYQYPSYEVNRTGEFEKTAFKRSLQELLQAVPQIQKNNRIGIDETLPQEEIIEEVVIEPLPKKKVKQEVQPLKKIEVSEKLGEKTTTPREELIQLLKAMNK